MNSIRLDQVETGARCRITDVETSHPVSQRLANFGLLPGEEVVLTQVAPLGDPIAVVFAGQKFSLRRREAAAVQVELLGG